MPSKREELHQARKDLEAAFASNQMGLRQFPGIRGRQEADHYQVLQVAPTASRQDIELAYKVMLKRTHPDVPGGSKETFRLVCLAYETLKDPVARSLYDRRQVKGFA